MSFKRIIIAILAVVALLITPIYSAFAATLYNVINLGTFDGNESRARAINKSGQIVGESGTAFLWEDEVMYNLHDLISEDSGWSLHKAYDINNAGQIVGDGMNSDGEIHGFLLTPAIPEPSSSIAGIIALLALVRKRW